MTEVVARTSPLVAIASVSVIVFSLVGVGVMTGLIPSSRSTEAPSSVSGAPTAVSPASQTVRAKAEVQTAPAVATSGSTTKPAGRPVSRSERPVAAVEPTPHAPAGTPAIITPAASEPVQVAAAPLPVAQQKVCAECGVIDAVNVVEQKGQGSAVGVVGGAVVGGLLGNQVGNGRGNTVATIAGAVGGALAGNEIEKRVKSTKQYNVSVRMDDGNIRHLTLDAAPPYAVGEKVKVMDGRLVKG